MKRSGTSTTFTLVCVAVLLASYGIGLGIREIRFRNAAVKSADKAAKPNNQTNPAPQTTTQDTRSQEAGRPDATFFGEGRNAGGAQDEATGGRGFFNGNMSDEERAQMRDRFGGGRRGRRGMNMENLSDEERAAMEERRQQMMERFQNMTDEERAQFQGGRGGRGGRSRGGMSDFGAAENDSGFEANNIESDQNDNQSQDNGTEYQENEFQSEDNGSGQEDTNNNVE